MNTEVPSIGQQYRVLPWFFSAVQKTLSSCTNSTLLRASRARASKLPSKFHYNAAPAIINIRIPPKCSSCPILFLCCPPKTLNLSPGLPLQTPTLYPVSSIAIPEGLAGHLLGNSRLLTCQLFFNLRSVSQYSPFSSTATYSLSHTSVSFARCEVLSQRTT